MLLFSQSYVIFNLTYQASIWNIFIYIYYLYTIYIILFFRIWSKIVDTVDLSFFPNLRCYQKKILLYCFLNNFVMIKFEIECFKIFETCPASSVRNFLILLLKILASTIIYYCNLPSVFLL